MVKGTIVCLRDSYPARHLTTQTLELLNSSRKFELLRRADQAAMDLGRKLSDREKESLKDFWIVKEMGKQNYYSLPVTMCNKVS